VDPGQAAITLADFTALVERYEVSLYVFLQHLVRDPDTARDLLQDTFAEAWRAAQRQVSPFVTGKGDAERRRWLYRVAYRRAIDILRRHHLIRWESLDVADRAGAALAPDGISLEDRVVGRDAMRHALEHLAPADVACLLLIVVQGFTAGEALASLA
jgi:DNA-directed RNA polymerase specialized sigma24 family protein